MTVEPGMGGQKLIKETILKVNKLNQIKDNYNFIVEVDGGINNINIKDIDADIYVVGSYITSGDYNKRVEELKEIINEKESK
jgi:ribulose-phosphate 3-epimerase